MATALQITEAFLADILAKLQDVNTPPTADETSNLLNQYQTLTQLIRDGYQWTAEDLEDLPATLRAEFDIWKNDFTESGTWTPVVSFSDGTLMTYSAIYRNFYERVGNTVYCSCYLSGITTNSENASSSHVLIDGLPFVPESYSLIMKISYCNLFVPEIIGIGGYYSSGVRLLKGISPTTISNLEVLPLVDSGRIMISFEYKVA